jgi:hypothetical protein
MDRSRTPAFQKRGSSGHGRITDRREAVREFLAEKLPAGQTKQADYLADVLLRAGARYDRYAAKDNRIKWKNYAARRNRLEKISKSIQTVIQEMAELDLLSHDDLSTLVDPIKLELLMGSLLIVGKATGDLAAQIQKSGPPKDLAEERWILELADIYENAFSESSRRMSYFYQLLELSRPETLPRYGKLSRKQIDRVLSQRKPISEKLSRKRRHDQKVLVSVLELLKNKFPDIPEENLREQLPEILERLEAHGREDGRSA